MTLHPARSDAERHNASREAGEMYLLRERSAGAGDLRARLLIADSELDRQFLAL
jgi:hypothetical protein